MNGNDVMKVHPSTAAYRALIVCTSDAIGSTALYNAAQNGNESEVQLFLSDTLAQTFYNRSSVPMAIGIRCGTHYISQLTEFIASGAAVGFIRCCLLFFKGAHGLVVPSRHGTFFL
jgi:hypothetical protein